jgi:hypothetical protein
MDEKKKAKLERCLMNARSFLWGVSPPTRYQATQKEIYAWLRRKQLEFKGGPYPHVLKQLLADPGIEKLINDVIIPRVQEQFGPKLLEYMRECWMAGTVPDVSILSRYKVSSGEPFFDQRTLFHSPKWMELAWVWFEEIELE